MKILFDHHSPFFLAHGGFQTQIEQTKHALEKMGIEVETIRWWDDSQSGDIIHYFGRPSEGYIHFAHQKGMKVVVAELHSGLGSRSAPTRFVQKILMQLCQRILPASFTSKLAWEAYRDADAFIALTSWEASLMHEMFGAAHDKIHVIPNGVEEVFFLKSEAVKEDYLVCTATITERKRVLELAQAAVVAQTPIWIIGKPYTENDPYYLRFVEVAERSGGIVRYEGGIGDRSRMAQIYREARGFVLLSTMESLSLSALEAAACGCPLLLSDLPWARSVFGNTVTYIPTQDSNATAAQLRKFWDRAPGISPIQKPKTWLEVGREIQAVYQKILVD